MSAFVVSHKHINAILSYANSQRFAPCVYWDASKLNLSDKADLQKAAEILLAENIRSVNHRYPDTIANPQNMPSVISEIGKPIVFSFEHRRRSPVEIIKACNCYDYQAGESDDYCQTYAARIIDAIRGVAISNLPGYDDAAWEIHPD